jgi:hypothetical protein
LQPRGANPGAFHFYIPKDVHDFRWVRLPIAGVTQTLKSAVETAADVEIKIGGFASFLMMDFHSCLEKPPLESALRLFHSSHSDGGYTHTKERKQGQFFSGKGR